jgi:hypothetical protein
MLSYNTSYHSTIATTPFELLCGMKLRLPSLSAPEIERNHYGKSFVAERLQLLQKVRQLEQQRAQSQGKKYKDSFNLKTEKHNVSIGQKVWLLDNGSIRKNTKLTPKWISRFDIIDVNDNNVKLKLKNVKMKVVVIMHIKPYFEEPTN